MSFTLSERIPLSTEDLMEADFLKNLALRNSAFPIKTLEENPSKYLLLWHRVSKQLIHKISKNLPRNSKSRVLAREFVNKLPILIRNFIVSKLSPDDALGGPSITYSLDLGFGIPTSDIPKVTIVIPVYNQWWFTYRCLRAIQRSNNECHFEVIVVDDCSTDQTEEALKNIRGIRVLRNSCNLGYLESTNLGASLASPTSDYIVLLNNDTEPIGNWLDELLKIFSQENDVAIVGSTLFFPNGILQESGGQIFNTANGWNIGRGFSHFSGMFKSLREVDYCSAASVMVEKKFWLQVGGFDSLFKPAYYEDTDLAMNARNFGLKVFISPRSWVIHHEGASHGTALSSGTKKYQVTNQIKFAKKWEIELESHWLDAGFPRIEYSRNSKGIVVLCDRQLPDVSRDSGSQRTVRIAQILISLGYHVVIASLDSSSRYVQVEKLRMMGIEIHENPQELFSSLRYRSERIKFYWCIREEVYDYFEKHLVAINSKVPFIADLLDIRHDDESKTTVARNQLKVANRAEAAVLVSPTEARVLSGLVTTRVFDIWYDFTIQNGEYIPSERSGIVFVGGFRHLPNVEGILWFAHNVVPILRTSGFQQEIVVIGSGLSAIHEQELTNLGLKVLGFQADLSTHYSKARLAIVPLKSGAGLKGKLAEALSFSLPVVATTVGIEGFLSSDQTISPFLCFDEPVEFANAIMQIAENDAISTKYSNLARNFTETNLGPNEFKRKIQELLDFAQTNHGLVSGEDTK